VQNDHIVTNSQAFWSHLWRHVLIIQALEQMDILFVIRIRLKFTFETLFAHIKGIQTTFKRSPNIPRWRQKKVCRAKFKIRFKSESYRSFLAIIHFCDAWKPKIKIRHVSAVPLKWAINPNFRLSADGLNSNRRGFDRHAKQDYAFFTKIFGNIAELVPIYILVSVFNTSLSI